MNRMGRHFLAVIIGCLSLAGAGLAEAAEQVDLELVLAVDVSTSVDPYEAALQRNGYVEAISHPSVVRAIRAGPSGRIAVLYVEWAGEFYQHVVVGWTVIEGQASADAFGAILEAEEITSVASTSISGALDFARRELSQNDYNGGRKVVDISGDGQNVSGRSVLAARDDAVAAGITINGLPIVFHRNPDGTGPSRGLNRYYEENVIGGPGAFVIETSAYASFKATLVAKLVREIRGDMVVSVVRPKP